LHAQPWWKILQANKIEHDNTIFMVPWPAIASVGTFPGPLFENKLNQTTSPVCWTFSKVLDCQPHVGKNCHNCKLYSFSDYNKYVQIDEFMNPSSTNVLGSVKWQQKAFNLWLWVSHKDLLIIDRWDKPFAAPKKYEPTRNCLEKITYNPRPNDEGAHLVMV
jgi:hypothetical protein